MKIRSVAVAAILLAFPVGLSAQHCAPIYESYLSEVSVKWIRFEKENWYEKSLKIHTQFAKLGGTGSTEAYQGHLVAYLDRDAAKVPAPSPGDVLDPTAMIVLHTQVMRRNEVDDPLPSRSTYDLDFTISQKKLVELVLAHAKLGEKDRDEWYIYYDRIRFAVFVPVLEDEKYSVLDGLPEDRHECNYGGDRALLFQELPCRVKFSVGPPPEKFVEAYLMSSKPEPMK